MIKRSDKLTAELRASILDGNFGSSGDLFMTVRGLSNEKHCSLHCAAEVFSALADERLIYRIKNRFFITAGRCHRRTPLGKHLSDTEKDIYGVILSSADNPFFGTLMNHLQEVLVQKGSELVISCSGGDAAREIGILDTFLSMKCKGVFCCVPINDGNRTAIERYPLPIVMLAEESTIDAVDSVLVDNYSAGVQVARHLKDAGSRDFYYITEDSYVSTDLRLRGFISGLNECGYSLTDENIGIISTTSEVKGANDIRNFALQIVKNSKAMPIGIFCVHDLAAVEMLKHIKKHGLTVPNDVKLVGFDNLPVSCLVSPRLTTVSYRYKALAEKADEVMRARISSPLLPSSRQEISSSLTVRESTKKS